MPQQIYPNELTLANMHCVHPAAYEYGVGPASHPGMYCVKPDPYGFSDTQPNTELPKPLRSNVMPFGLSSEPCLDTCSSDDHTVAAKVLPAPVTPCGGQLQWQLACQLRR